MHTDKIFSISIDDSFFNISHLLMVAHKPLARCRPRRLLMNGFSILAVPIRTKHENEKVSSSFENI